MFDKNEFINEFVNYYKVYDKNEYDISLIFDDFIEEKINDIEIIIKYFIKDDDEIKKLLDMYNTYELILYSHDNLYLKLFDIIQKHFDNNPIMV